MKVEFSLQIFNRNNQISNNQISNSTKIGPVGDKLFHADGWTDMKLTLFVKLQKRLQNEKYLPSFSTNISTTVMFSRDTP
jgi:hypothetical protein